MASEADDPSSSQDVTPVPAIALVQSRNENLSSNNCPDCKVLSRHLKISREWNNFFRLKLDQTDMLLHVAADYKRQKQRCLQLQMSLDQQSRECGEMREQLTNLLVEVNPLKERVQLAEHAAKEERLRREKAESDDCNLRFLIEQQTHKIKKLEEISNPNLIETMEKKISHLKAEICKLKQDNSYKSRGMWELKQEASLGQSRQQRTLKKAYWGLSLAHKYGSLLLSQGQLSEEESSKEWVLLKSVFQDAERALDTQYLALCQRVRVRPTKEAWLEDFKNWPESAGDGEYSGGEKLEKLIQDHNEEIVSEEDGEEVLSEKKTEENLSKGNYQHSDRSQDISEYKETASSEPKSNTEGSILLSKSQENSLPEMLTTSLLDTPTGNIIDEGASHIIDSGNSKNEKAKIKSASILNTSAEDSESDAIPCTGGTKVEKIITKSTAVLDLSAEYSADDPISSTGGNNDEVLTNPAVLDKIMEGKESDAIHTTGDNGDRTVLKHSASLLDTSAEDSDSDPIPSSKSKEDAKVTQSAAIDISSKENYGSSVPRNHNSVDEITDTSNTKEVINNHAMLTSSVSSTTKHTKSDTSDRTNETGHHTSEGLVITDMQEPLDKRPVLSTSMEDHSESLLRSLDCKTDLASQSLRMEPQKDTKELKSTPFIDAKVINSKNDHNVDSGNLTPSLASYHLDEELRAVLEKMRPHEKLEDMESSSPHSAEGPNHVKTDLHGLHGKQNMLSLLSDSEEEKDDKEMLQTDGDEEDDISMPPRILTTQMSEGFHITTLHTDNDLHDDLDLSTETCDLDGEVEEDKDIQKRASVLHFPQNQSFTCDMGEEEPLPKTMQSPVFMPEEASDGNERQQISCQPQLQQAVDNDSNTGSTLNCLNANYKANLRELRETFRTVDDSFISEEIEPMNANDKETYMEEQDESNEDLENNVNVLERNTKAPKPKETAVQGKSIKSVEECTREETTEIVNEAIPEKKEQTKTKEVILSKAKTQRPSVTGEHKISDEKDGSIEKNGENLLVPEKKRNSSAREGRTIDASGEKNKDAEEKAFTNGIKERITVLQGKNFETIMKVEATHSVGHIPLDGQERMSETSDGVFTEDEENKSPFVLNMNVEMIEERNEDDTEDITLGEEERILSTDAAKEAIIIAESIEERTTYSQKESISDCERKINNETEEKIASKSPEKIITKTVEHKTAGSESILVHAQKQNTKDLKEKFSHPDDERANEKKTVHPLEKNFVDGMKIKERAILSLETSNIIKEFSTEAVKDRNTFVAKEIRFDKKNQIVVAEQRNNDTLEQKATDTIQNRSNVAMEEKAKESTKEKNFKDMRNKNNGERTTEAITKRNSDIEENNIKSLGKKKTAEKNIQSFEERTAGCSEERNAEVLNAGNVSVAERCFRNENDNVRSKKRIMRKVLKWMVQNEGQKGEDYQETGLKLQPRRQIKFESELGKLRQEEKGRKFRSCVLRRLKKRSKLGREKKVKKQNVNWRNVMTVKERRNEIKLEEKSMTSKFRHEGEVEEESKKEEKEKETIKEKKQRELEKETGKNRKNEGNLEETEFEAGVEYEENESRIGTEGNMGMQDEIVMKFVEEVNDEEEEKGSQDDENIKQTVEEELKGEHRKNEEMTEEEQKKMVYLEEKETHKEQKNNKKKQEEDKRIEEKKALPLKDKKENEDLKSFKYEVEEESKLELKQKEGNTTMKEKECQKNNIYTEENSKETQRSCLFEERPIMDTSKQKKNIVFCWNFKRTERGKVTKFIKLGRLMRVIPDPPGSLRHSVYTIEHRIQSSEGQQRSKICREMEVPVTEPQGINDGQEMFLKDRNTGNIKDFEKTSTLQVEEATGGMMYKKGEREIHEDNYNENLKGKKVVVRNETALKIESKRKKETSCLSDERITLCSSGELQDRNSIPKQCITCSRNTAIKYCGHKVCHTDRIRQLKSKSSKIDLFGSDSSNSSEENEKIVEKISRVSKKRKQQQLQSWAYTKSKCKRLPVPFDSAVNGKEKNMEQIKISRTRERSSSSSSSFFTSEVTQDSDEESVTEKRSPEESWNQESNQQTSSESDIPQRPFSRKCKATLIVSETDEHEDDNSSSVKVQRKRKRMKKLWANDSTVTKEIYCNNDSDHSSPGLMRHVTSFISARLPTAHSRTKNEVQRKMDSESRVDSCPSSATLYATPSILQKKSSTVSTEQQKKIIPSDKRFETVPVKFTRQHSISQKQQKTKEIITQRTRKPVATKNSPITLPSLNHSTERSEMLGFGLQDMKGSSRILRKDGHGKKPAIVSGYTSKRKHGLVLLDIPPHSKRQKGGNSKFSPALTDFSNESDITLGTDEVSDHTEETLILPSQNNNSVMLQDKEKNAQPQSESVTQVLSDISDHNEKSSLMQSDCENENELVIDENVESGTDTNAFDLTSSYFKATVKTQKNIVRQVAHLGPVAFIDHPRYRPKPTAALKLVPQIPVPAGPDYIDKLFLKLKEKNAVGSELNNSCEISCSPAEDINFKQSQRNGNLQTEGTTSQSHSHPTYPLKGIDNPGQCQVPLPNIYTTVDRPPATVTSALPSHSSNFSHAHSEPTTCQPFQTMPSHFSFFNKQSKSDETFSTLGHSHPTLDCPCTTSDQLQPTSMKPNFTPGQSQPTPHHSHHTHIQQTPVTDHPHSTFGQPHQTPGHTTSSHSQSSLSGPQLHEVWIPEIVTERVNHCDKKEDKHAPVTIEYLKETLEEVVAAQIQSMWWVTGLKKLCNSLTNSTLPSFLRLVIESILRSDPLEPKKYCNALPPRLFRLFQVVCILEQRLTPQHPSSLRRALLRAIQAIVVQSDMKTMLQPHSLATLTAWYVASVSIDGQHEAGQEWGRGRAFLVDLLFHHPGTAHLAILTAANTCSNLFLNHPHNRGLSGLEQVVIWLAHHGQWEGRPGVRSDLIKWLDQHLKSKKSPQSPAILAKNLVTLLKPEKNKDMKWGAVVGLVILTRWHGRSWAKKHLLPALSAATTNSTAITSQEKDPERENLLPHEDLKNKISHLFGNLGKAVPCVPQDNQTGDIVKKMEHAVNTLLYFQQ